MFVLKLSRIQSIVFVHLWSIVKGNKVSYMTLIIGLAPFLNMELIAQITKLFRPRFKKIFLVKPKLNITQTEV